MSFRNSELWRTFIKEAFNVPVKLVKFCCMLHITRTYILDFAYVHTLFLSQIHIFQSKLVIYRLNIGWINISNWILQAPGPSMLPTLNLSGDILLVDRISPRFRKVAPGDIVLVVSPENPRKIITKRLTAMEDDIVTLSSVDPDNTDKCDTLVVCFY